MCAGLVPVSDPLTPLGYVDQLSLLLGLHEQSHVVIVNVHQWAAEVHVFTFQKRLKVSHSLLRDSPNLCLLGRTEPSTCLGRLWRRWVWGWWNRSALALCRPSVRRSLLLVKSIAKLSQVQAQLNLISLLSNLSSHPTKADVTIGPNQTAGEVVYSQ